jgi:hypothetical protein
MFTLLALIVRRTLPAIGRKGMRSGSRRLAASFALVALFFAGAAISAGAGDTVAGMVEGSTETTGTCPEQTTATEETTTAEAEAGDPVVLDPESGTACAEPPAKPATEPPEDAPADVPEEDPAGVPNEVPSAPGELPAPAAAAQPGSGAPGASSPPRSSPGRTSAAPPAPELETHAGGVATIWLHRALPDPTPRMARLSRAFARRLRMTSAEAGVHWALVLGVLRARSVDARVRASAAALQTLADQLAALNGNKRPWRAARALPSRNSFAKRAVALSRYNRAVGLRALVTGLRAATPRLEKRVLRDPRLAIYAAGRADIELGRIDVRVLVLMLYLAEAYGQVTVSSLESGHRLYSRPGVISAHVYGLAVDIAALESKPIYGNQEPGGLTERAVRRILLLPAEVHPQQVISLLGLGGPSFPLGDHGDHIHVGY